MKSSAICVIFVALTLCCARSARCKSPAIAVVLKAPKNTTYEQMVPVLTALQKMEIWEIEYAFAADGKISVEMKLREDINFANLEVTERRLKRSGVDEVSFSKIAVFPWKTFTVEAFDEARRGNKPIMLFVKADWDLVSAAQDRRIFDDPEIIRSAKQADFIAFRFDMTQPPGEEDANYLKQLNAYRTPTLIFFSGGEDSKPRRLNERATREQVLKILQTFPERTAAE